MIEAELANPKTTPERLYEIAVSAPQYANAVAQHPNAYPELIAWCQQQMSSQPAAQKSSKVLWWILGASAAIITIAAVALMIIFSDKGTPAVAPQAGSVSEDAEVDEHTDEDPNEDDFENSEFEEVWLDTGEVWNVMGNVLVTSSSASNTSDIRVKILQPGFEIKEFMVAESLIEHGPNALLVDYGWTVAGNTEPEFVAVGVFRAPGSGLTPETYFVEAAFLNLASGQVTHALTVDGIANQPSLNKIVGSNLSAIAVEVESDERIVYGVSSNQGQLWRIPGHIAADTYDTAYIQLAQDNDSNFCPVYMGVDVAEGKTRWQIGAPGTPSERDSQLCTSTNIPPKSGPNNQFNSEIELVEFNMRSGDRYIKEIRTGQDLKLPGMPELFDSVTGQAYYHPYLSDHDPQVIDTNTGEVLREIKDAERLDFKVHQILNGLIYAETKDERIIVRVSNGEVLEERWGAFPVAEINSWTYYSDGLLTNAPHNPH